MARNLWRDIVCEGTAKLFYPLELGGKYERGSDFERFALWCACYPYFDGNRVAERMKKLLEQSLGEAVEKEFITPQNSVKMWRWWCDIHLTQSGAHDRYNAENCDENCQSLFESFQLVCCDEKSKNISKETDIDRLALMGASVVETDGDIIVKMTLDSGMFTRPDRYHAERARQKILNGEKCNHSKMDLLKIQLLCDIILSNKCGKVYVYIDAKGEPSVALELATFLEKHKMYSRIYLKVRPEDDPQSVASACLSSPENVLVTPFLTLPTHESEQAQFERFLSALAAVYPIGAVEIISKR